LQFNAYKNFYMCYIGVKMSLKKNYLILLLLSIITVTSCDNGGSGSGSTPQNIPPSNFTYSYNNATYTQNAVIVPNTVNTIEGSNITYSVLPDLPRGLVFDQATGAITGTPEVIQELAQVYTVTAKNEYGSAKVGITITVNREKPKNLSYLHMNQTYTVDNEITANTVKTITGSGLEYSVAPALPRGLVLDKITGTISGTPVELQLTATTHTITARNSQGATSAEVVIKVNNIAPAKFSYEQQTAIYTVNGQITENKVKSILGSGITYSVTPALPAGLSLDVNTGTISGKPTKDQLLTTYTVKAENALGFAKVEINITINKEIPKNLSYSQTAAIYNVNEAILENTVKTIYGSGITYSIVPALPTGLSLNTTTGAINGVPAAIQTAKTYTVTARNDAGSTTANIVITINKEKPKDLYYTHYNVEYTQHQPIEPLTVRSVKGSGLTFSIKPALPNGLVINAVTGTIDGTPTVPAASKKYIVTATNSEGSTTQELSIGVFDLSPRHLRYEKTSFEFTPNKPIIPIKKKSVIGTVDQYYTTPALPDGLLIDPTTGTITGAPTTPYYGSKEYWVVAKNIHGFAQCRLYISVKNAKPSNFEYKYSRVTYTPGQPITPNPVNSVYGSGLTFTMDVFDKLPEGLVLNYHTGEITGTPTSHSAGAYYLILAENSLGSVRTRVYIEVLDIKPAKLVYQTVDAEYVRTRAVTPNKVVSVEGTNLIYTIGPELPRGMYIDPHTGEISGTPTSNGAVTYVVRATNGSGYITTTLTIRIMPIPPGKLTYNFPNPVYAVNQAIRDNAPILEGGEHITYSVAPQLPAGLSIDIHTGKITGIPTVVQSAAIYTVTASNATASSSVDLNIEINTPPVITRARLINTTVGAGAPVVKIVYDYFDAEGDMEGNHSVSWQFWNEASVNWQNLLSGTIDQLQTLEKGRRYRCYIFPRDEHGALGEIVYSQEFYMMP
jgi:hypothetical protein